MFFMAKVPCGQLVMRQKWLWQRCLRQKYWTQTRQSRNQWNRKQKNNREPVKPIAGSTKNQPKFISSFRHTLLLYFHSYCAFADNCVFLTNRGVYGSPMSNSSVGAIFPTAFYVHASVSPFDNSLNISNFPIIIRFVWWSVISDLWCYYCDLLKAQMIPLFSSKIIRFD